MKSADVRRQSESYEILKQNIYYDYQTVKRHLYIYVYADLNKNTAV